MPSKRFSVGRRIHSDFSRTQLTSYPPHYHQDDQNQKNQSNSTAGIVPPSPAVRPGGQYADEDENQNNDQHCTHAILLLSLFPISAFISFKAFKEISRCFLAQPMSCFFIRQGLFFSINNPTTFVTTNPNHFLLPPACGL